jgi:hypothetical protein
MVPIGEIPEHPTTTTIWIPSFMQNLRYKVGAIISWVIVIFRIMWFGAVIACPTVGISFGGIAIIVTSYALRRSSQEQHCQ